MGIPMGIPIPTAESRAAVGTEFLPPYPPHTYTHTHGDSHTHGRHANHSATEPPHFTHSTDRMTPRGFNSAFQHRKRQSRLRRHLSSRSRIVLLDINRDIRIVSRPFRLDGTTSIEGQFARKRPRSTLPPRRRSLLRSTRVHVRD